MSSPQSLFRAGIVALVFNLVAIIIAFSMSIIVTTFTNSMTDAGIRDVHSVWADTTNIVFLIDLIYLIPYILSSVGIIYFIVTAVRSQKYDAYGQPIEEDMPLY